MIEAQRYPEDFDGIVVNAPWLDQTGFTIGAMWNQKALSEVTVTSDKMALVADSVMTKCDRIDGLKDGLIDDPDGLLATITLAGVVIWDTIRFLAVPHVYDFPPSA